MAELYGDFSGVITFPSNVLTVSPLFLEGGVICSLIFMPWIKIRHDHREGS